MSVALPLETGADIGVEFGGHIGDVLRSEELAGTVVVREFGFAHSAAACTCGWAGKRRYLKAAAEQDAWMHSIQEHCAVAVPLVRPALTA